MKQKEIENFIYFLTNSKNLTKAQRLKRDQLLAKMVTTPPNDKVDETPLTNNSNAGVCVQHETSAIVNFLHQFTETNAKALKFTTHIWETNAEGHYDYSDFKEFKTAYLEILTKREPSLYTIQPLCKHLWQIITNFLINDEPKYSWSEFKLKIGYNKYLEKWMNENPGKQPFAMPLRTLPAKYQHTELVNGRYLVNFGHVVDVFKNCIEFRDNDLYYFIKELFKSSDHILDEDLLESLRGISFYTDTELVKDALRIIASNMRSEFPKINIRAIIAENSVRLTITQVGSFSDRDINDPKIRASSKTGQMCSIISRLKNLCDFSIESRFRVDNIFKYCCINYLSSEEKESLKFIKDVDCPGFSYILTFYTYSEK